MLDQFGPIEEACKIELDERKRKRIGIVGAGEIVHVAHLPTYRALGIEVVAITDTDRARASAVADEFNIPKVANDASDLISDDDVEIVDIAVFPWAQPEIAHATIGEGKHLLCQKPLALDIADAQRIVDHADEAGLKLAVNMQLRWDEGIRAAKAMVEAGWIGEALMFQFDVHIYTPWENWPWVADGQRLDWQYHTIHYLDSVRYLFGDPEVVFGATSRLPSQTERGETRTIATLVYGGDRRALLHTFHRNTFGDSKAEFRIDGTEGSVRGTLGLLYDYPRGRPDTLQLFSHAIPTDGWVPYPVTTRWLPDAFAGPMVSLLHSIGTGDDPDPSGRDHIGTLELVDALYRSAESGNSTSPNGV